MGEAGDGDGGRGSAAAREEGGQLGMGGSGTGGGFGVWAMGLDDAEGGREGATPLREEAQGFSSWPHMLAPSPVVLPAERRTKGADVALAVFLGVEI
jgi:hypothetical protein